MKYLKLVTEESKNFKVMEEDLLPTDVVSLALSTYEISFCDSFLLGEAHLTKRKGYPETWIREKYFENDEIFAKSEEGFIDFVKWSKEKLLYPW